MPRNVTVDLRRRGQPWPGGGGSQFEHGGEERASEREDTETEAGLGLFSGGSAHLLGVAGGKVG